MLTIDQTRLLNGTRRKAAPSSQRAVLSALISVHQCRYLVRVTVRMRVASGGGVQDLGCREGVTGGYERCHDDFTGAMFASMTNRREVGGRH